MGASPAKLSPLDATFLVMGGILGVGIFFTPAQVADLVPHPVAFFGLWLAGSVVAMCGAATFAELGGTFPRTGGWFEFLREIYGPFVAFLFAWVVLGVIVTGAIAVIASFGVSMFLGLFGVEDPRLHLALAATALIALTGLMLFGVKVGATFQNVCMVTKLTAVAALVAAGLAFLGEGAAPAAVAVAPPADVTATALAAASLPVLFAFGGWQHLCSIAEDVRSPQTTVPRAILWGVGGVAVAYLLLNAAAVRGLGMEGLAGERDFAGLVAERAFGQAGARAVRAALAVSALGVCAVNVIVNPAIYVALAKQKLFFARFAHRHPRTGAPVWALGLQLALALVYLTWSHLDAFVEGGAGMSIDTLTGSVVFAEWIFHGLVAWGLIRLRSRRKDLPRPYRSLAYPLAPALYLAAALAVVVGNLATGPGLQTAIGLSVLAAGAAVYGPWRRLMQRNR